MEISIDSMDWSCRTRSERKYPERTWGENNMLFTPVKTIEQPFLQKMVDYGGLLCNMQGEWTYLGLNTTVMFHVYDGFINLECIATDSQERGKGSAGKIMEAIVKAAKETNTEIRLRACNVTGHGWDGMANHMVVASGMNRKGKIPVAKLPKWYGKYGFVKVADCIYRGKKQGVNMVFNPQK